MEDLKDRNANDAERRGRVSRHEALGWITPNDTRISEMIGSGETQVEPGVEQVVFVFQQLQPDARREVLAADLRQLDQGRRIQ